MNQLAQSLFGAADFPKNLIGSWTYAHHLQDYYQLLNQHEDRLFCDDSEPPTAAVDLWDWEDPTRGFQHQCVRTTEEMKRALRVANPQHQPDPRCRFIFLHAPNARAPLNVTRAMLVLALSYHQVMPAYLDFLFPFGHQIYPKDFHFSGFRHEDRVGVRDRGVAIPELGRSGRGLQLCYGLKSVESSTNPPDWPWSIRQTAVYHAFDLETGEATWFVVKANRLLKSRIMAATRSGDQPALTSFQSPGRAFASALEAHLIICQWAGEKWRWYINFLEETLQKKTRSALLAAVDQPRVPVSADPGPPRRNTAPAGEGPRPTPLVSRSTFAKIRGVLSFAPDTTRKKAVRPSPAAAPQAAPARRNAPEPPDPQQQFTFRDLQDIHHLEEKMTETLLVLKMNANVLTELKQHYRSIVRSDDCPDELKRHGINDVERFERRVTNIIGDLQVQQDRLETLLHLLTDRKTLSYGILNYQNMEASRNLAEKSQLSAAKSQLSAEKMEAITAEMHQIAKKTEQETVSMKIITLVTLFFLPGTFISTLMSTDIVRFSPSLGRTFSRDALGLYFAISLPLMALTFFSWWLMYRWVEGGRHQARRRQGILPRWNGNPGVDHDGGVDGVKLG